MTIGKKIKHYRQKKSLTQDELASLTKIHSVTIKKYETDTITPSPKQINRLADALNVSYEELTYQSPFCEMNTIGDVYSLLIALMKNINITFSIENNKLIISNRRPCLFLNDAILHNMLKWEALRIELDSLLIENFDILQKKGNSLSKSETELIYKIEELELKIERLEIQLKSISTPLIRGR